jgi:hypothetical protein
VAPEAVAGSIGAGAPEGAAVTDAGFTAGVVGGPVLDGEGHALGVAVKRDNASAVVPITDVVRILDQAHVDARTNPTTNDYRKAALDMSNHWYKRARPIFERVHRTVPEMPWVTDQLHEAEREIAAGHDQSPSSRPIFPVAVAAVLFAVDSVAVTSVLRRRVLRTERARRA